MSAHATEWDPKKCFRSGPAFAKAGPAPIGLFGLKCSYKMILYFSLPKIKYIYVLEWSSIEPIGQTANFFHENRYKTDL